MISCQQSLIQLLANMFPPPLHKGNNVVAACVPSILSARGEGNGGQFTALAMRKRIEGNGRQVAGVRSKGDGRQITALERATVGKLPARPARATAGGLPCWQWASAGMAMAGELPARAARARAGKLPCWQWSHALM